MKTSLRTAQWMYRELPTPRALPGAGRRVKVRVIYEIPANEESGRGWLGHCDATLHEGYSNINSIPAIIGINQQVDPETIEIKNIAIIG